MKARKGSNENGASTAITAIIAGAIVPLLAAGCGGFMGPAKTAALSQVTLDAPKPEIDTQVPMMGEAVSNIGFTLLVPQDRVREMVGKAVPQTISSNGHQQKEITDFIQNEWISYDLRRGDVNLKFRDNVVQFAVPIQGQVSVGGHIGVGPLARDVERTIDIAGTVTGDLKLAVNNDFTLAAKPTVHFDCRKANVEFGPIPSISLCDPLSAVFDEKAPAIAQGAVNDALQKLQIRAKVEDAWKQLHVVKQVTDSPPVWVEVVPQKLRMKPLNLSSDPMQLSFAVDAKTVVVGQNTQPANTPGALPKLAFDPKVTGDVSINLPIAVPVDALSERLNNELKGKQIPVGNDGSVTVKSVKVGTAGEKVICTLDIDATAPAVKSNISGTVYLAGKIHYDPAMSVIKIEGLDWDAQTKNALVQNSAWLLHDSVINAVKQKAVFDAGPVIASAKDQANGVLKDKLSEVKGPLVLNVNLESIKLKDLKVENNQAFAFFSAAGRAGGELR